MKTSRHLLCFPCLPALAAATFAFLGAFLTVSSRAEPLVYGLTSENTLMVLSTVGPDSIPGPRLSGIGADESAVAIDFRPFTSELVALTRDSSGSGRIYSVHPTTGTATPIPLAGPTLALAGDIGMDFNPVAVGGTNALRIVTSTGQNYRIVFSPVGATVNVDNPLNIPGGASGTNVVATAYSNNRGGLPGNRGTGGTAQYAIDSATDRLYRVNPPNNGTLTNGLPLGVDIDSAAGLDIATGTDRALAVFSVGGTRALYEIHLGTGQATLLVPAPANIVDLAVPIPSPNPVPLMYGLSQSNTLVRFNARGSSVVRGPALSGIGSGEELVGMDFRPLTGELHAVTRDGSGSGRLYRVQLDSGVMTPITLAGAPLQLTGSVGMDFNPAAASGINALRIVTGAGRNYRLLFSEMGATVNVDTNLNVAGGGMANVSATAYSNNRAGLPGAAGFGGTVQFAIDSSADLLYRVNPPNGGVLTNGLPLGIDVDGEAGLDIVTGTDRALGLFQTAGTKALCNVDLNTGSAMPVRFLPADIMAIAAPIPVVATDTWIVGLSSTNSLLTFAADGSSIAASPLVTGLGADETLVAIDFRPFTSELHALSRDPSGMGRLYIVDPAEGTATSVALTGATLNLTGSIGMDFNPVAVGGTNALRIVTSSGQNYRLVFQAAGAVVNVDGALNSTGAVPPQVIATAYINNRGGMPGAGGAGGTIQYALDAASDVLHRVNPPNNGTLIDPRPIGMDFGSVGGLDASTRDDRLFAALQVDGSMDLYEIHPASGAANWMRNLPPNLTDIAVVPPVSLRSQGSSPVSIRGGVGPFAIQRVETLSDPFCGVAGITGRTFPLADEGAEGFIRAIDLAAVPAIRLLSSLSGDAERPTPVTATGTGTGTFEVTGNTLSFSITYSGLSAAATMAHLHGAAGSGESAGVLLDLAPFHSGPLAAAGVFTGSVPLSAALKAAVLSGRTYINIHTMANPGGELRGQVGTALYQAALSGAAERPSPVRSPATGFGNFMLNGTDLTFDIVYRGFAVPVAAAHIHGPASAGGSAGVLIDLGPFSVGAFGKDGRIRGKIQLTAAQLGAVIDGLTYVNLHTPTVPSGEIRGQVRPVVTGAALAADLSGSAERPNPVTTPATGFASAVLSGDTLTFRIAYRELSGPATMAHVHGPANASANAGVQVDLARFHQGAFATEGMFQGSIVLNPEQRNALLAGNWYLNIHTAANPGGEIRGQWILQP